MRVNITVRPNEFTEQRRIMASSEQYLPYSAAYVGRYTYCWNTHTDNAIEFTANENKLIYNLHIGSFNSIGNNMECVFARNHNYKMVSTGALSMMYQSLNVQEPQVSSEYNHKGNIMIQNDVWVGENVTIMPGVIVRNGAVIARNSHVVKDVPPYAIVGGNPARVIGYRYTPEQIEMLQEIAWWDWSTEKLIENVDYFTEDIEAFCERFYPEAKVKREEYIQNRNVQGERYFAFVDFYENYASYPKILEQFLDRCVGMEEKHLVFFIQEDSRTGQMNVEAYLRLMSIVHEIREDANIRCTVEVYKGTMQEARTVFRDCSHYVVSRTFDAVYYSCLADRLDMKIISGVDSVIPFVK